MSVWPRLTVLLLNGDRGRRRGQLPGSQTAKARPGYRVQSLRKGLGHRASIESVFDDRNL